MTQQNNETELILNDTIDNRKELLAEYLFPKSEEKDKWLDMDKKVLINQNMKPMTYGDWMRMKNYKDTLNLNTNLIIGNMMSGNDFWNKIHNEIIRFPSFKTGDTYNRNANPNFFVAFYEKYKELEINGIKPFELIALLNDKDEIFGVHFKSIAYKLVRSETLKSIEYHLMYILRPHVLEVLGEERFKRFFFQNYFIQYLIKTSDSNQITNRYSDWVYIIDNPDTKKQMILTSENDETTSHDPILDVIKDQEILVSTGIKVARIDLSKRLNPLEEIEYFRNYHFMRFILALYNVGYEDDAILLYMIEYDNFDIEHSKIQIQVENKTLKLTLGSIYELPWFNDDDIIPDELIEISWGYINTKTFFVNWDDIYKKYKGKKPVDIAKLEKNNLYVTSKGFSSILHSIPYSKWSGRDKFLDFEENFKTAYLGTIKKILSFKEPEPKYKYDLLKELKIINSFANDLILQDEYFENFKAKMRRIKLKFEDYFHPVVPYLQKSNDNTFIIYSHLINILSPEYRCSESYLTRIYINKNDERCYDLIMGYKLLSKEQVLEYIKMSDEDFKSCFNDGFIDD
jgi:hypothetical protein